MREECIVIPFLARNVKQVVRVFRTAENTLPIFICAEILQIENILSRRREPLQEFESSEVYWSAGIDDGGILVLHDDYFLVGKKTP